MKRDRLLDHIERCNQCGKPHDHSHENVFFCGPRCEISFHEAHEQEDDRNFYAPTHRNGRPLPPEE